ncbi:hypothetical protein D5S17_18475 [Pseudonocardiaceae bacterium YIM PH 21723]|nr:hypothetical protein D5S17_18475 [Pseudonocardiaceae bacterium YIM PH 21723]
MRPAAIALAVLLLCTGEPSALSVWPAERALVDAYFADWNAAAARGPEAQDEFFSRTQDPEIIRSGCEPLRRSVFLEPQPGTLQVDPGWLPPGQRTHPSGRVFGIAVLASQVGEFATDSNQIGMKHVVIRNGRSYGFAPCTR